MSHIVTIKTELRDRASLAAACRRLALPEPVEGTAQLYSGQASGLVVRLPDWLYPVVIDTDSGTTRYDNYGGSWGEERHLHRLLQAYAVERVPGGGPGQEPHRHRAGPPRWVDPPRDRGGRTGMKKVIRVIVSPTGEARVETRGFAGGECREASRPFEEALGLQTDERLTAEFYQEQPAEERLRHSQ